MLFPTIARFVPVTDAFVRASGTGLLLPRMIPVGDPEIDERIGGALEAARRRAVRRRAIDPTERLLRLASIVGAEGSAEGLRLASDLARTLDALADRGDRAIAPPRRGRRRRPSSRSIGRSRSRSSN